MVPSSPLSWVPQQSDVRLSKLNLRVAVSEDFASQTVCFSLPAEGSILYARHKIPRENQVLFLASSHISIDRRAHTAGPFSLLPCISYLALNALYSSPQALHSIHLTEVASLLGSKPHPCKKKKKICGRPQRLLTTEAAELPDSP